MKILIFILMTMSSLSFAGPSLDMKDFNAMTFDKKVMVIDAYREFLRDYSTGTELGKFSSYRFSFFTEAWASGNFDCFYAGWPSRSTPKPGGGRLCTSPANGNPDYPSRASGCGANTLLCQPAIFGSGLCVNVATREQRNSAFNQCENSFREAGRSTADVVRELSTPEKRAELADLLSVSDRICREGFQSGTTMCNRLKNKIAEVNSAIATVEPSLVAAVEAAVEVTQNAVEPEPIDCDPNTPGIQTTPPLVVPEVTGATPEPAARMQRIHCPATPTPRRMSPDEQQRFLRENNISVVYGTPTQDQIQGFINEFQLFPESLRNEMRSRGSRINLIVGEGVGQDPSWNIERDRAPVAQRESWNNSASLPGTGGFLGDPRAQTPTRIVINRLDYNGSASLFLHEHAHTLNSSHSLHGLSSSQQWREALARDTRASEFLNVICGDHCDHPEEAFAELFANYFACDATKNQMREFMPNVSRLFERMTSARDLMEGRVDLSGPVVTSTVTSPGERTVPEGGIVVSGGRGISGETSVQSRVDSGNTVVGSGGISGSSGGGAVISPGATVTPGRSDTPNRVPSGSGSTITPSRALELVNSGELTYHGRGLLPGSDTVGSCVFSNPEVYVIVHACRRDGREAVATNIEIITRDGKKTGFYIETSARIESTVGLPSQLRREHYDGSWRISYQELGPVPQPYSLESMRTYLQGAQDRVADTCFVGGMAFQSRSANCMGRMNGRAEGWAQDADAFHAQPPEAWYNFLRSMRQRVQASAGR